MERIQIKISQDKKQLRQNPGETHSAFIPQNYRHNTLTKLMCDISQFILSGQCYSNIKLRDITRKENYGPISLININPKIPKKMLGNRIQQCTKRIIHVNQLEFIASMQSWFIIQTSISIIHSYQQTEEKTSYDQNN